MNNKGFTLVELLGVITIVGILAVIASASITRYITKTRFNSYINMSETAYIAAQNCVIAGKCNVGDTVSTSELISNSFLSELVSPISSHANCSGNVQIKQVTSSTTEYNNYEYVVSITCPKYTPKRKNGTKVTTVSWPNAKKIKW